MHHYSHGINHEVISYRHENLASMDQVSAIPLGKKVLKMPVMRKTSNGNRH